MNSTVATLLYALGISGLFYLNRDDAVKTSKALWLPVIYLWVLGSRPVSFWFGVPTPDVGTIMIEGSPIDTAFFAILLVIALGVLVRRGSRVLNFLGAGRPVLLYFSFCLLSVFWSDFPGVAFKKWLKAIEDVIMVLVVLTDQHPKEAVIRLYSRTAIVLMPLSLLSIKYFPRLGRSYDPWTGRQMYTGLTGDKNEFGVITFVLLVGVAWRVLALARKEDAMPKRRRILFTQVTLLALGLFLLKSADSATSLVSFVVAAGVLALTSLSYFRRRPAAIHAIIFCVVVALGLFYLIGGRASAARAVGRDSSLTGRTDIWAAVIQLAPNPVVGAGFESFWLNQSVHEKLWEQFRGLPLNEAHDGYIEAYLELGWVGVSLIALILIEGYRRSVVAFGRDPTWGGLLIAYIVSATLYSVTEAGFRMMDPIWIFLLFSVVASGGIVSGIVTKPPKVQRVNRKRVRGLSNNEWAASQEGVRNL